ncbi:MAG TPA: TIGR03435 family protein [Gemmatimonadaceae bacterium]|nr:TIGR03435 family protein [Gemmatimonadaceae bacterium]
MNRARITTLVSTALATIPAATQQSSSTVELTFASASLEPALPNAGRSIRLQPGGVFEAKAVTLRELIQYAYQRYGFDRREVVGGPAWIDSLRLDVLASAAEEHWIEPDGAPRKTWAMLRSLLEKRFQLRIDEASRTRPVYVLMVADRAGRLGASMRRTTVDCGALMRGDTPPPARSEGVPCGTKTPPGRLFANTVTMQTLASMLSSHLDRPVIDSTGLDGRFDIQLESADIKAAPDYRPGPSDAGLPPTARIPITDAVREQLGLNLEPGIGAVSVLVVRHAERPTLR